MHRPSPVSHVVRLVVVAALATGLVAAGCGGGASGAALAGVGASFPSPIYGEWISGYRDADPDVSINYRSVGSSAGREQFIAQAVDFAGTDAFMLDEEIAAALTARPCADVLHIPTVFGGVAMAYNIEGLDQLVLDGETIAGIGMGTITNINDPAIGALNPGVALPNQPLTFVHRSDGSGTTFIFTTYLTDVSDVWAQEVGAGSTVPWFTGIGGDQNDGVAAAISQQPGGIGYLSYEFAAETSLKVAAVVNEDGVAIAPSSDSVSAAVASVDVPDDFRFSVLGVDGNGYPITGATWILAYTCGMDVDKGDALKGFLRWALTEGSESARELNYAPLPDELRTRVLESVERINEQGAEPGA